MVSVVEPLAEDSRASLLEQIFAKNQSMNKLRERHRLIEPTVAVMGLPKHEGLQLVQQVKPSTDASRAVLLDQPLATN
jgi:hypothetical protein